MQVLPRLVFLLLLLLPTSEVALRRSVGLQHGGTDAQKDATRTEESLKMLHKAADFAWLK